MKFLLPNMFCTGDDDGVIKVRPPATHERQPMHMYPSSGTRENHRRYVVIPTTLISSPTFYGSATKCSSYPQGSYSAVPPTKSLILFRSPNIKRRWHTVSDGCTWKEIRTACPVRGSGGRVAVHRCHKKASPSFLRSVFVSWTYFLGLLAGQRWSSVLNWESYRYLIVVKDGVTVSTGFLGRSRLSKIYLTFLISICIAIHNPLMHSAPYHPHIPPPTPLFLRDPQMVCCVLYNYFLPNSSVSLPIMGRSPSKELQSTKTVREDG